MVGAETRRVIRERAVGGGACTTTVPCFDCILYVGCAKRRGHRLVIVILSNLNRFAFFTVRFLYKFAVEWILNVSPHLAYVATLHCETSVSAKQAINDKLQGNVATYLWCGGIVNK